MKRLCVNYWLRIMWLAGAFVIAAFLGCATNTLPTQAGSPTGVVNTSNGPIRGRIENGGMSVFKGVRYGAAPVYTYLLAWETPVDGGRLRSHHALDLPPPPVIQEAIFQF